MITNVPVAINVAQRAVTLKHLNSLDCTVYYLPQDVIDATLDAGGRDWLDGVKVTRATRTRRTLSRCTGECFIRKLTGDRSTVA